MNPNNRAETGAKQNGQLSPEELLAQLNSSNPELAKQFAQYFNAQPDNNPTPDHEAAEENNERFRDFPADCLPDSLRYLGKNVAAATRTPSSLSYVAGLSTIAASLGYGLVLETFPGELVGGNLYILPIADSGTGKSRVGKVLTKSLHKIHDAKIEEWKESYGEIQAEIEDVEGQIATCREKLENPKIDGAKRDLLKKELATLLDSKKGLEEGNKKPELYTTCTTEAKLATLLRDNNEVLNAISFEAGGAVQILAGKFSKPQSGAITTEDTLMLSAFCQERYKNDRLTTESVELIAPTVNMMWMVQPRYIPSLFGNDSLASGGFLARCLTFNSHAEAQELTGDEPEISRDLMEAFHGKVEMLFEVFRFGSGVKVVRPSEEASEIMRQYHNECVRLRKGALRDIQQFPARWCEIAWKVALNLHAMEYGAQSPDHELTGDIADKAIRIVRWFASEFLELMRAGREDAVDAEAETLQQYILNKGELDGNRKFMPVRTIARNRFQDDSDKVRAIVKKSKSMHIKSVAPKTGGKAQERVYVGNLPTTEG